MADEQKAEQTTEQSIETSTGAEIGTSATPPADKPVRTRSRKSPAAPAVPTGFYLAKATGYSEVVEAPDLETARALATEYIRAEISIEPCDKPGHGVPVIRGSIIADEVTDPVTKLKTKLDRVVYERS